MNISESKWAKPLLNGKLSDIARFADGYIVFVDITITPDRIHRIRLVLDEEELEILKITLGIKEQ